MDSFTAVMIAEGAQEADSEREYLEAWAHLIKTGLCWSLQGWFGRAANNLMAQGVIDHEGNILI